MYTPSGLILFNKINVKRSVSKSLVILFLILHAFLGLNCGFIKRFPKAIQVLVKVSSITASLFWLCFLVYLAIHNDGIPIFWYSICIFEYASLVLILNLAKNNLYGFIQFTGQRLEITSEFGKESLGVTASAYIIVVFLIRFLIKIYRCYLTHDDWCDFKTLFIDLSEVSLVSVPVLLTLISYCIQCHVRRIIQFTNRLYINPKSILKYYCNLAESYDYIMPLYDRLMAVQLVFEVPKLMLVLWSVLNSIKIHWLYGITIVVLATDIVVRLVLPCVAMENIKSLSQSARLALHHRMLQETGTNKSELRELLEYMSARRLQHKAWRVIPLDMQLPLAVLSTCVTYLIVIVQFTHLY